MKRASRALVLACFVVAACGDDGDGHDHDHDDPAGDMADAAPDTADATMSGVIESRTLTFAPGKFIEVQFRTSQGDRTLLRVTAPDLVTWNVHGHAGGGTETFDEGEENPVDAEFIAPSTDSFWFLIGNATSAEFEADIEIEFFGDGEIEDWFL